VIRSLALAGAAIVLAAVWFMPLHDFLPGPFSVHMTMHMGVVAIAAPLIAVALAGASMDPVRSRPALFPPVMASLVELLVVWVWHAPTLHHAARESIGMLAVEQASFLAVALWLWLSALGGDPARRADRVAAGIVAMLLTSMHMTLLGALLALPSRVLYPGHAAGSGLTASLRDQHLGGAIMLAVGATAYLVGGLFLAVEMLQRRVRLRPLPPDERGPRVSRAAAP
jgi:putative membrane protein